MMGFDFEQLSTNRNYTAMERIHSISHFCANDGPRPKPLPSNYPYTGCYCRARFEEAKIYFDWHICTKERGCCQCFITLYFFKKCKLAVCTNQCYQCYLLKTREEKNLICTDANEPSFW